MEARKTIVRIATTIQIIIRATIQMMIWMTTKTLTNWKTWEIWTSWIEMTLMKILTIVA